MSPLREWTLLTLVFQPGALPTELKGHVATCGEHAAPNMVNRSYVHPRLGPTDPTHNKMPLPPLSSRPSPVHTTRRNPFPPPRLPPDSPALRSLPPCLRCPCSTSCCKRRAASAPCGRPTASSASSLHRATGPRTRASRGSGSESGECGGLTPIVRPHFDYNICSWKVEIF